MKKISKILLLLVCVCVILCGCVDTTDKKEKEDTLITLTFQHDDGTTSVYPLVTGHSVAEIFSEHPELVQDKEWYYIREYDCWTFDGVHINYTLEKEETLLGAKTHLYHNYTFYHKEQKTEE